MIQPCSALEATEVAATATLEMTALAVISLFHSYPQKGTASS